MKKYSFEDDSVYFKGKGGTDKKEYEVTIQLYKEVNKDNVKVKPSDRNIELILEKKSASEAFWPTLTKDSAKKSWIKCDFNKWNDESDSDDNANDKTDMMKDLYSYGGGDNGFNMSGGAPSFDDFSPDSDDEEETDGTDDKKNDIPDLE